MGSVAVVTNVAVKDLCPRTPSTIGTDARFLRAVFQTETKSFIAETEMANAALGIRMDRVVWMLAGVLGGKIVVIALPEIVKPEVLKRSVAVMGFFCALFRGVETVL